MKIFSVALFCLLSVSNSIAQVDVTGQTMPYMQPGLYYKPHDNDLEIQRITLSPVVGNQSGGGVHNGLGVGNKVYEKSIPGKTSKTHIVEQQPTFYLKLEGGANFADSNWLFYYASNPEDFLVIMVKGKRDKREFITGKDNRTLSWGSSQAGIGEKEKLGMSYTIIADRTYEIKFLEPLGNGEYCFIYTGKVPPNFVNDKVLDFSICK